MDSASLATGPWRTAAVSRAACRGFLLAPTLMAMALVYLLLGGYFSILHHEIASADRTVGGVQAFYLAEAGLDAANDLLCQDWDNYQHGSHFPMQESVSVTVDGQEVSVGEFDVDVSQVDEKTLRLTATGRTLPLADAAKHAQPSYRIQRTLSAVVARKDKPSFQRLGQPGLLEIQASYFDKDGVPDLITASGNLLPANGNGHPEGTLTAGSADAMNTGLHLLAGFTDVDQDGYPDLVLSDAPSEGEERPAAFIPAATLSTEADRARFSSMAAVDLLRTGKAIPFVAPGWVFLPNEVLSPSDSGTDVFLNKPVYDGTLLISWSEQ